MATQLWRSVACRVKVNEKGERVYGCGKGWKTSDPYLRSCPDCGRPIAETGRWMETSLYG